MKVCYLYIIAVYPTGNSWLSGELIKSLTLIIPRIVQYIYLLCVINMQ